MVEEWDPSTMEDEGLRQKFLLLMNMVEGLTAQVADLKAENQRLRDEINRLKGEQGKPKIAANNPAPDLSSQKERRAFKPHHKSSKQDKVKIDRKVVAKVDQEDLPADAVFKGYQDVVVQDIVFRTDNILFRREILLAWAKADVSGSSSSRLRRSVWPRSPSVGVGAVLQWQDE
jgi:hypothetical protein